MPKVAPSSPNIVYAITESQQGYVYRSDNYGENWTKTSDDARTREDEGFMRAEVVNEAEHTLEDAETEYQNVLATAGEGEEIGRAHV